MILFLKRKELKLKKKVQTDLTACSIVLIFSLYAAMTMSHSKSLDHQTGG
jgi:hypothetical protein